VNISPASVTLGGGGTQAFSATVTNDSSSAGVTWSIGSGVGTLSLSTTTGVTYTAPSAISAAGTVTLTATSITDGTKSATATITLNPVSVSISPATASLGSGGTQAFAATVSNDSLNAGVTWSIGSGAGALSSSTTTGVTYTAPSAISAAGTVTLTATSIADTTKTATATITLNPVSVSISPATASLGSGGTQAFAATVSNDPSNAGVTWSIGSGAGALSSSTPTGVTYTAPSTISAAGTVTLTATSITDTTKTATATITLNPISVSISPATASLGSGGTQAFAATVSNDSLNAGVTWSIGSGAGALSSSTTTGVTYTAPSLISTSSTVTLTATSITDGTKTATATITLSSIVISSLSTTSPTPLTPFTINASGVDPSSAITLTFSDSSGFSVTENPIRVNSSGSSMIAAVPLYINSATGANEAGTVSLVITQGTQFSAPVSVDIQDLPTVASYGATPGQISHQALIFEAMVIGQRLNELQAFQALPGNTVDTSAAQSELKTLLTPILNARSDVDSVIADSSTVISGGVSTTSGSPVQFDATALDIMDRVNGVFLSNVLNLSGANANNASRTRMLSDEQKKKQKGEKARSEDSELSTWIEGMGLVTNLASSEESMLTSLSPDKSFSSYSVSDYGTALTKTIGTSLSTASTLSGNKVLGMYGAVFSALPAIGTALGSEAAWVQGWVQGDNSLMSTSQTEMNKGQPELLTNLADLSSTLVGASSFKDIYKDAASGASAIFDMLSLVAQTEEAGGFAAVNMQSPPLSDTTPPSSTSQGLGIAQGTITVSGSTAQSGLDFCCFNDLGITGIVDADGNYESFIPLGASNTSYDDITLNATDPTTGAVVEAETVDLSGLDTSTPITVPTLDSSTSTIPTAPPAAGTYTGTCTAQSSNYTCCVDDICIPMPGVPATTEAFDFTLPSGVSLSEFDTEVCSDADSAFTAAGCTSPSCSYSASTSDSFTFNLSCTLQTVTGCTASIMTETCTASD
jgi:hypothetical protein